MYMRRTGDLVEVLLNNFELRDYSLTVEYMTQHKPFSSKLIEDLMNKATTDYNMQFDINCCNLDIQRYGEMNIYICFREKSNIVYLENEYINEEAIIDGIHKLINDLPDECIECGMMEVEQKSKKLDILRSKQGREIIRRDWVD